MVLNACSSFSEITNVLEGISFVFLLCFVLKYILAIYCFEIYIDDFCRWKVHSI